MGTKFSIVVDDETDGVEETGGGTAGDSETSLFLPKSLFTYLKNRILQINIEYDL